MSDDNTKTKEEQAADVFKNEEYKLRYICLIQHLENESAAKVDAGNMEEAVELLKDAIFMLKGYIMQVPYFTIDELVESIRQRPNNVKFETDKLTKKLLKHETGIDIADGQDGKLELSFKAPYYTTGKDEFDEV